MSKDLTVYLVEDDDDVRAGAEQALRLAGCRVSSFASAEAIPPGLGRDFAGIVITDVKLPGIDGLALLTRIASLDPKLPVILITGHGDISMAVEAMRAGAYDFIAKPFSSNQLVEVACRALEKRNLVLQVDALQEQLRAAHNLDVCIIGVSPALARVRRLVADLADPSINVLVVGETGTGKELVARSLHACGPARDKPFVAVTCARSPEVSLSSGHSPAPGHELFAQHVTKAGVLFLDELDAMPLASQVDLARLLQDDQAEVLGAPASREDSFRIIATSKYRPDSLIADGRLRSDLFYQLNMAVIEIPPLRERREDIPVLFEHFLLRAATRFGRDAPTVSLPQMRELMSHHWPGNVRELNNVATRFVLGLSGAASPLITMETSPRPTLPEQVSQFEQCLISNELRNHKYCVASTSEALGIPKKTLYDKIQKYGLSIRRG